MRRLRPLAWALALALSVPFPAAALTVNDIAREFICPVDDCGKVLAECDMECGNQLRAAIAQKIEAGWDKPRIVQSMVEQYGERLLAAPTKKGFNLAAWVAPFVALLLGAGLVGFAIRRWVVAQPRGTSVAAGARDDLERKYGARLERELARFEKGE